MEYDGGQRHAEVVRHETIPVQLGQLLTIPVQRVPRYRLLISELKKHRPNDDPMTSQQLEQVLSAVDTICHSLDEFTLEQEQGLTKVAQVADLMGRGGCLLRQAAGRSGGARQRVGACAVMMPCFTLIRRR